MEVANSGIIVQNWNLDSCLGLFGFSLKNLVPNCCQISVFAF